MLFTWTLGYGCKLMLFIAYINSEVHKFGVDVTYTIDLKEL